MRKDPEGRESQTRIYVTPRSTADAAVLDVLLRFGIRPALTSDRRGPHYDVTLPASWSSYRKAKFRGAIAQAERRG